MDNSNCDATMNTDYRAAIRLNDNHHFNVFVKCWSSASVTCVTSTHHCAATAWIVISQLP